MPATNNLESRIADWISGLDARKLPTPVIDKLQLATLDTFAAMLSGVTEPVTQKVIPFVVEPASRGEASIIGTRARARSAGAALANGTMAHACDYDELELDHVGASNRAGIGSRAGCCREAGSFRN